MRKGRYEDIKRRKSGRRRERIGGGRMVDNAGEGKNTKKKKRIE